MLKLEDLKEIIVKEKDPDAECFGMGDRREWASDEWGIANLNGYGGSRFLPFGLRWLHDYSDVPSTEVCQKLKRTWEKHVADIPDFGKIKLLFAKNSWKRK